MGGGYLKSYRKKKKKLSHKFIILGILFLILAFFLDVRTRPTVISMCNYHLDQFATTKINEAIMESIKELDYNYDDYTTIKTSQDGKILAIHSNAKQITNMHTSVMNKVDHEMEKFNSQTIDLHTGSLSGIVWLSGLGPIVSIKVTPKGKTSSEIVSTLEEAGINQTLHRIKLKVVANIAGFIPGYSTEIQAKCEYVLAESLIVGSVPNHCTKIISNEKESESNMYAYTNPNCNDDSKNE